jgi:hypothetical protein
MFYISFASGSRDFVTWIQDEIYKKLKIKSHVSVSLGRTNPFYQLKYSKYSAIKLIREMYREKERPFLSRKKLKINQSLSTIGVPLIE